MNSNSEIDKRNASHTINESDIVHDENAQNKQSSHLDDIAYDFNGN